MRCVVDKVVLIRVFLLVLWFSPFSTIPSMLYINFDVAVTRRTNGRSVGGNVLKRNALSEIRGHQI